jgi:hypothetical protein
MGSVILVYLRMDCLEIEMNSCPYSTESSK